MKGVILAGGMGTRLLPLTRITNKHLLPVYNKPMVYYPLRTLIDAGMKEILIVSGPEHAGHFISLFGSGREFGVKISYEIQDEAGGIAQALGLAEYFSEKDSVLVVLGDNIIEDRIDVSDFKGGARIYLKQVDNPQKFGVASLDSNNNVVSIEEKPRNPKTNCAVTGVYVYDNKVFDVIKTLKPSPRGELEITDVNNYYIGKGKMDVRFFKGFWVDAGASFETLFRAAGVVRIKENESLNS